MHYYLMRNGRVERKFYTRSEMDAAFPEARRQISQREVNQGFTEHRIEVSRSIPEGTELIYGNCPSAAVPLKTRRMEVVVHPPTRCTFFDDGYLYK